MTFRDQVILITGGSSGIGLATARAFAREGAHVWILARHIPHLEQAEKSIREVCASPGQKTGFVSADVSRPDEASAAVAEVTARVGTPDIVINSHGVSRPGYFQELNLEVFREQMEVNYYGVLHIIKAVAPAMMERRSGHIVNIASGAALLPAFGYSAYSASKYAVRGLSDVLRLELKPYNVLVSVVYPPDTDTPQLAWEAQYKPPETREVYGGVVLSPDYVAKVILDGVRRRRYTITPGLEMTAFARLAGLLGDWQFKVLDELIGRAQRKLHVQQPRRG